MATRTVIEAPATRPHRGMPVSVLAALLGLLLVLAACDDEDEVAEEPLPAPVEAEEAESAPLGVQVAVVLSPRTTLAEASVAAILADLARLEDNHAADVRGVRGVVPDTSAFVRDLGTLMVEDGADLTCIFGSVGRTLTSELRARYPDRRFCALTPYDPPDEPEEGVDVIAVRTVELGHLLGRGAAALAGDGEVVLALGSTEFQRGRFREGLAAGLGTTPVAEVDDDLAPEEAVAAAALDGATVLMVGNGPQAAAYLAAGLATGLEVIAPAELVGDEDAVAITWELHWEVILAPAVDRLLGRDDPAPLTLGLADGVFRVAGGDAASAPLVAELERVQAELIAGDVDPFEPVEVEEPDDEDEAEEPDDEDEEPPTEEGATEEEAASDDG